jgi:hypothetical protein
VLFVVVVIGIGIEIGIVVVVVAVVVFVVVVAADVMVLCCLLSHRGPAAARYDGSHVERSRSRDTNFRFVRSSWSASCQADTNLINTRSGLDKIKSARTMTRTMPRTMTEGYQYTAPDSRGPQATTTNTTRGAVGWLFHFQARDAHTGSTLTTAALAFGRLGFHVCRSVWRIRKKSRASYPT